MSPTATPADLRKQRLQRLDQLRAERAAFDPNIAHQAVVKAKEAHRQAAITATIDPTPENKAAAAKAQLDFEKAYELSAGESNRERLLEEAEKRLTAELAAEAQADAAARIAAEMASLDSSLAIRAPALRNILVDAVVRHLLRGGQPPDTEGLALVLCGIVHGGDPFTGATSIATEATARVAVIRSAGL